MDVLRVIPFAAGERTPLNLGDERVDAAASTGGGSIVRTIVGLIVVVAVIYALQWILKQAKASKEGPASGLGLATVASLPVGGNRSVQLVRAGREYVLVGIGEHGVTALRRYTEEEADELGLLPAEPEESGPKTNWLDQLRARTVIR